MTPRTQAADAPAGRKQSRWWERLLYLLVESSKPLVIVDEAGLILVLSDATGETVVLYRVDGGSCESGSSGEQDAGEAGGERAPAHR